MVQRRRQDVRYTIQFPVQLSHAARSYSLVTEDVSFGGIFLCTASPPSLLQLVQVQFALPVGARTFKAHAMTVHVVQPANPRGRPPGTGVQFYGLDQAARNAWHEFMRNVSERFPKADDQTPLRMVRSAAPELPGRRFGHHEAVVDLKLTTLEALEEFYTRDMVRGTVFVSTPLQIDAGANVLVNIPHPSGGAPLLFETRVLLRTTSPPGLAIELRNTERFREEFLDFVRGAPDSAVQPRP